MSEVIFARGENPRPNMESYIMTLFWRLLSQTTFYPIFFLLKQTRANLSIRIVACLDQLQELALPKDTLCSMPFLMYGTSSSSWHSWTRISYIRNFSALRVGRVGTYLRQARVCTVGHMLQRHPGIARCPTPQEFSPAYRTQHQSRTNAAVPMLFPRYCALVLQTSCCPIR